MPIPVCILGLANFNPEPLLLGLVIKLYLSDCANLVEECLSFPLQCSSIMWCCQPSYFVPDSGNCLDERPGFMSEYALTEGLVTAYSLYSSLGNGGKVVGVKPPTSTKKSKMFYGQFLSIPSRLDSVHRWLRGPIQ
jgi:hypothetical protein